MTDEVITPEPTEVEKQAMEMGWKPKEDFDPDTGKEWVSAETFVARKPLFEKIEKQSKELKTLREGLHAMKGQFETMSKSAYDKALSDLRKQRKEALANEDAEAALDLNNQIARMESEPPKQLELDLPEPDTSGNEVVLAWRTKNAWYGTNQELTAKADALGRTYVNMGMAPEDVLATVTKDIKKLYPENFKNPNREKASAVETKTNNSQPAGPKNDAPKLTPEEVEIMNKIVRTGVMTKEEYLKAYAETQGE